jgi:hypothetical protein
VGWPAWTAVTVLFTGVTLLYLRPVWRVWESHVPQSLIDPVFNLYVLKWGVRQIHLGLPDVWNANLFHPNPGTLALSDHLLGPAAMLTVLLEVLPGPIAGYNFLFFTSFVGSALATCWVVRRSGASWTAAALAGWIFAFSPFRLTQMTHLQMLMAQWIPPALWFWDRLLAERRARHAAGFLVFYLLNLAGGCYLAYMIHIPMAVLALNRLASEGRALLRPRSLRVLGLVALIAGSAAVPLFLPYVRSSERLELAREDAEIEEQSATLASYVRPSTQSVYFGTGHRKRLRDSLRLGRPLFFRREDTLFAGFLATALSATGLVLWWKRFRNRDAVPRLPAGRRAVLLGLLAIALAAYLLANGMTLARWAPESLPRLARAGWWIPALALAVSLGAWAVLRRRWGRGPVLRWAEMDVWERGLALVGAVCFALTHCVVYIPLARVLPGLDGMRVPARFYVFVSLAIAWFAARGAGALLARVPGRGRRLAVAGGLGLLLALEMAPRPIRWYPLRQEKSFPEVYHWIARQEDVKALVELPISQTPREVRYLYFSTLHWKPIANGYSGHRPPSHRALTRSIRFLPGRQGLDLLREQSITHLVVHTRNAEQRKRLRRWDAGFAQGPDRQVELVFESGQDRVYRLLARSL